MDSCPAARRRSPVNEDDLLEDRFFYFSIDSMRFRTSNYVLPFIAVRALNQSVHERHCLCMGDKRPPPVNTP